MEAGIVTLMANGKTERWVGVGGCLTSFRLKSFSAIIFFSSTVNPSTVVTGSNSHRVEASSGASWAEVDTDVLSRTKETEQSPSSRFFKLS